MKKIVLGNDFNLIIPVSRKVHTSTGDVIQDFNLLPACTDLQVNLVNFNETISLSCSIDVEHTSRLIANVDSSKLNIGNYALEVKGKIYGNAWRSNEYEQIAFVNNNASADEVFDGEIIEGESSVEVDHVFIFFNPTTELGNLINQVSEVIGEANTALDTMKKATEGANNVDIDLQESNLEITRRTGEKKTFDLETLRGEQGPQGDPGIQGPKGPKGDPGDTVSISRVTATIDDNIGVPTVTTKVSSDGEGATIDFNFSNLRGLPGVTGEKGDKGDSFKYSDFTEAEIKELQKPATDAAEKAETAMAGAEKVNAVLTKENVLEVTDRAGVKKTLDLSDLDLVSVQSDIDKLKKSKIDKTSIVQETGDSEDNIMSQKAITKIVHDIKDGITTDKIYDNKQDRYQNNINDIIINGQTGYSYMDNNISLIDLSNLAINENYYITPTDQLVTYNGRNVSDYLDVSNYSGKTLIFWKASYFKDAGCTLCFYDANKKLLYTDRNYASGAIIPEDNGLRFVLLSGIFYIRVSFSSSNKIRLSVYDQNETNELTGIIALTEDIKAVDILCNSSYKMLFYDNIIKTGGSNIGEQFYVHLNKGVYVKKIISYTELNGKFIIVKWYEGIRDILVVYSTTLTLDSKDGNKYIYSLPNRGYFVNTDDCYFIPAKVGNSVRYKPASAEIKNKVKLYSRIEKGNEQVFTTIILTYDLLFLSSDPDGENEKVEQEVDTIKVSKRFFGGKEYVAFGDSITDASTGAEEAGLSYPSLIGRYFGFITVNLGSSGSTPHDHGTHMNLSDTNLAKVTSDTMLVTISGGTNGWVTSDDIDTLDRNTSIGAFNYAINYIRNIAPKCVIILCPMYANSEKFIKDYERIAENKGVGLAPILNNNLINWRDDVKKDESNSLYHLLLRDGVHPTNYGAFRMAALIKEYAKYFII